MNEPRRNRPRIVASTSAASSHQGSDDDPADDQDRRATAAQPATNRRRQHRNRGGRVWRKSAARHASGPLPWSSRCSTASLQPVDDRGKGNAGHNRRYRSAGPEQQPGRENRRTNQISPAHVGSSQIRDQRGFERVSVENQCCQREIRAHRRRRVRRPTFRDRKSLVHDIYVRSDDAISGFAAVSPMPRGAAQQAPFPLRPGVPAHVATATPP